MERKLADITIQIEYLYSTYSKQFRNVFSVKVKNDYGDTFEHNYDFYSKTKECEVTDVLFENIMLEIFEAVFVNSETYDCFEEWCNDFGGDESEIEAYKYSISIGDKLSKVISQEWIDMLSVYEKISN